MPIRTILREWWHVYAMRSNAVQDRCDHALGAWDRFDAKSPFRGAAERPRPEAPQPDEHRERP